MCCEEVCDVGFDVVCGFGDYGCVFGEVEVFYGIFVGVYLRVELWMLDGWGMLIVNYFG